jgi:hypothetical protein
MDEFLDTYLGKILKNWAGRRQAPGHVRARVLWLAAHPPVREKFREIRPVVQIQNYQPMNWEHILLTYDIVHSFQNGLTVSRILA